MAALAGLACAVTLVHGCTVHWAAARLADLVEAAAMPSRPALVTVRTLEPEAPRAPPVVARAAVPVREPMRRPPVDAVTAAAPPASSATPPPERPPEPPPDAVPPDEAPAAVPTAASEPGSAAPDAGTELVAASAASAADPSSAPSTIAVSAEPAASAASATSAGDGFVWPESTLVSYRLSGNRQGELHGHAEVEWIRQGATYQMHMDIVIGVPFAPLLDRHLRSAGRITADGLVPQRFDEDSKRAFQDRWRLTMLFDAAGIKVQDVRRFDTVPGVQDTLSQFGQLSYRFGRDPSLLTPGGTVSLPLALPRHVDVWSYRVLPPQTLDTPFGPLEAAHLAPTRLAGNGDLSAEIWVSPTLRYLPVRIRIAQNADTWIDLLIDRKPQLEAAAP